MPTTVTKTIGTGGDYTTLQSWEDASPANLVTSDQIWRGECFNQEFFSSSAGLLNVSGSTTDATRYKELTTYAGASFVDNASVQTNALRYNASNGAGIRNSYAWGGPVSVNESYFRISKLQIAAGNGVVFNGTATTGLVIDKCIFENSSTVNEALKTIGVCTVKNSLMVQRSTSTCAALSNGTNAYNCTFVRTGSSTGNIFTGSYGTSTLQNCAFFGGATTLAGGSTSKTYVTCYTDTASPPSGCTTVAYDTSTGSGFENKTDSTRDFRIKTGSALIGVGTTDATNAATDIVGTSRPQGTGYDVGAWELVSGAATHTASGVLTGDAATVSGTATHLSSHAASGALTGQASTLSGTANRFRVMASSGALTGQSSQLAGSASRSTGAVAHSTSGALTGASSTISGSASRFRAFAATGALATPGAVVAGSAARSGSFITHSTSGALAGQGSTIAGVATYQAKHATPGALVGQASQLAGTAARTRVHDTTGALTGQAAQLSSTASRFRAFGTSGAINPVGASLSGTATRFHYFASTGVLAGQGSTIAGSAVRNTTGAHVATGALAGQGSLLVGSAIRMSSSPRGMYPLEGIPVVYPSPGEIIYPLSGIDRTYPLG